MKFFKKTNILITTTRRLVVHNRETNEIVQCPHCVEQMMAAHTAAELFGVSSREIYRLIETGTILFRRNRKQPDVCLSLFDSANS